MALRPLSDACPVAGWWSSLPLVDALRVGEGWRIMWISVR
jgi:hypothetical protein